jgi:hypothetical protein
VNSLRAVNGLKRMNPANRKCFMASNTDRVGNLAVYSPSPLDSRS